MTLRKQRIAFDSYSTYAFHVALYASEEVGGSARMGWRATAERWRTVAKVVRRSGRGRSGNGGSASRGRFAGLGLFADEGGE